MKRIFLGAILSLFAMVQTFAREFNADDLYYAGDFSVGGIFYQITSDNTCMVVEPLEATELGVFGIADYISGDIVIPEIVSNNGDTYIVTNIGEGAFNDCFDLTSVVIPNSVINIGKQAFSGCIGLSSVVIPNSVTSIGDFAFYDCSSLTSIIIPDSVVSIGKYAFINCMSLKSVTIGNSVESIGEDAFASCVIMSFVNNSNCLDAEKENYWGARICNSEGLIIEDNTVTHCAFWANSVTIPNNVTKIGYGVFSMCPNLSSVTIPKSVTSIGEGAFGEGCGNLQTLKFCIENPNDIELEEGLYGKSQFSGIDKSTCVLYVPKGSLELYKAAPVWQEILNIEEMSEEETAAKSTLADSGIKVFGKGMNIIVKGALESAPVKVSGTDGVTLRNATGNGTITMDTKGIYFVTVGDQTFKVWL